VGEPERDLVERKIRVLDLLGEHDVAVVAGKSRISRNRRRFDGTGHDRAPIRRAGGEDSDVGHFLKHALPHQIVRMWEQEIAGKRPFSLQMSLIVGVGVVAFLVCTQSEVFITWVTYATGVASTLPKVLQFFDNLR